MVTLCSTAGNGVSRQPPADSSFQVPEPVSISATETHLAHGQILPKAAYIQLLGEVVAQHGTL